MATLFRSLGLLLVVCFAAPAWADEPPVPVGAASVDITPDYAVRLSGYSSRRTPFESVAQRIWAKALVIGGDGGQGPAVLLTVDNCGVPAALVDQAWPRLQQLGLRRERLVVCSSHSHTAPWLIGFAPFLAQDELSADEQEARERYTRKLVDWMVEAVEKALARRTPAQLSWTQGEVGFAANRRVLKDGRWAGFGVQADGPVDHRLPLLVARSAEEKPVAVWANYACHCTTLGGDFNQVCGDWSGYAQEYIEADFPSATALVSIGCGADANPEPRGRLEYAERHGRALADEVKRLLAGPLRPLPPQIDCRRKQVELPFGELPSRAAWEEAARAGGSRGLHGRYFLDLIERGEPVPTALPYPIAAWTFGDALSMVFLPGEVVVDYATLLNQRHGADRLWITAYANDVPCYIPSKRILREGGYEADQSMLFYGRPTRLAPETEDIILQTVAELLPK
jgi:neutral ceramidase